jgi:Capsule polysaccharide biosynthesis protein
MLRSVIAQRLAHFETALAAYRRIFARVRPKLILMTQNGVEKALFLAAHEAGIVVIEGQHGSIGHVHPAYSYPRDIDYGNRSTFPSVFLTFSEYWINSCFYPAGECIPIGNNYFAIDPLPPPEDPGAIMFVSVDMYHDVLRDWVMRLARILPNRKIIYKLHPNQHQASRTIVEELAPFKDVEVVDASVSVRMLLAQVSHVVLIQSTVALEALQTGRRVCILPVLHYRVHQSLFQSDAVTITRSVDDLVRALDMPAVGARPPSFFDPFNTVAAAELLTKPSRLRQ